MKCLKLGVITLFLIGAFSLSGCGAGGSLLIPDELPVSGKPVILGKGVRWDKVDLDNHDPTIPLYSLTFACRAAFDVEDIVVSGEVWQQCEASDWEGESVLFFTLEEIIAWRKWERENNE